MLKDIVNFQNVAYDFIQSIYLVWKQMINYINIQFKKYLKRSLINNHIIIINVLYYKRI